MSGEGTARRWTACWSKICAFIRQGASKCRSSILLARLSIVVALLAYAPFPLFAARAASPDFGPNVLIFDPSMPAAAIQKAIDGVYATQQHNEFGPQRNALLFLPGNYHVNVPVGYYTQVMGLGASPDDTRIGETCTPMPACQTTMRPLRSGERRRIFRSLPRMAVCSGRSRRLSLYAACTSQATSFSIKIMAGRVVAGCQMTWWTGMLIPEASSNGSRGTASGVLGRAQTGTWFL